MVSAMNTHLDASVGAEVEVELRGMGDAHVHRGPGRNVPTSTNLLKENIPHSSIHFEIDPLVPQECCFFSPYNM